MTKQTFLQILDYIQPDLHKLDLVGDVIPPAKRLAIGLARLTRGDYYKTIAEMYGVGETTAATICNEVSRIVVTRLWDQCVSSRMPSNAQDMELAQNHMPFPFAFAAIDGCHIPVQCPAGGTDAKKAYYNFKNFYSVILLALVDGKGRFIWASCGQPGNCHDSTLLQSTELWDKLFDICHLKTEVIGGVTVPSLVLADGAFPFRTYVMKRYSQAVPTQEQKLFNRKHGNSRVIVENAFGLLKGRFRVLSRKCESSPENVKYKCLASVILHNFLLDRGDLVETDNLVEQNEVDIIRRNNNAQDNAAASRVRDLILPLVQ